jgi:hypothetical protein
MLDVYFSVSLVFLLIIIVVLENTCWMMVYSNDSLDFLVIIVLEWHFSPSSLVFFCSPLNKHKLSSRFGCSHLHPIRQLTHTRCSDGVPDPDGEQKKEVRIQIRHYRNIYLNRPDTIVFLPLVVDTSGRLYDDFIRLFFLDGHRDTSVLSNELPEESDQFRFLRVVCFD